MNQLDGRKPGILLVDLDSLWLRALEARLRQLGCEVWVATEPRLAIEMWGRFGKDVDLALLDDCMVGVHRLSLLSHIQHSNPHVLCAVMAVKLDEDEAAQLKARSVTQVFAKPAEVVEFADLVAGLARSIKRKGN